MALLNPNYLKLKGGYLFPEIQRRVEEFKSTNPEAAARLIPCGIGDVTQPLPLAVREAMHRAVDEMGSEQTFRGYGPSPGHEFLRRAIAENDYRARGLEVADDEVFVSDGSKCDCGNILDILGPGNRVAVMNPAYPVYVDSNVMAGNAEAGGLVELACTASNGFLPEIPSTPVDVAYLCFPNNPTGAVPDAAYLRAWVEAARRRETLILFDAAYEAFVTDPALPRSIYEIPGARDCAIEFRSFSKNGGFTGVRCGFTVVPKSLLARTSRYGPLHSLHSLWARRFATKFGGVGYITQRGAEALYSTDGKAQVRALVDHYLENARLLSSALRGAGLEVFGGTNAPFLWVSTPRGMSSWDFFDHALRELNIIVTPGSGFGSAGEGWFRVSAFNTRPRAEEAARRFATLSR
jgi:LL-diaminopimelate aminotransferase